MPDSTEAPARRVVRSFIRRFRTEILAEWKLVARGIPVAKTLPAIDLLDHVPELLDEIADLSDVFAAQPDIATPVDTARRHAIDRLAAGFDVTAVVDELSLLRSCILTVWARQQLPGPPDELLALNRAIDRAIATSVARFSEARERTLTGIDRISTASLESLDLDDLLHRLLDVFVETTPAVDTAAILLVEGDRLRVRAVVGLDADLESGFSLAIGEGFAGKIADQRQPLALRAAYLDPIVSSAAIRDHRVRALYGIPLVDNDRLIGVAHMGSLTAQEFSQEDRQFFSSMAARATTGICHHMLRQELADSERRAKDLVALRETALAKLESLLAASPVGIAFLDRHLRYLRINDALAALNGKPAADHLGRTVAEVVPEVATQLEPMLRHVLDSGEPLTNLAFEKDGNSLLANYFPVSSAAGEVIGVGGIIFDVTEEQRAQHALRLEQARLQSILEHAPAAIWVKDAEGRILVANQRLADALGCPLDQLIGRRSDDVLPPEIAQQHRDHDQTVLRDNRALEVEELVPAATGERTFLSIKFPIPSTPPLVGGIATEITERKNMENELRALSKAREEVLAVVSHDLRTPLGTIQLGVSTLQAAGPADHRTRRHLEMIHRASARIETLIEDLLDTANIRAGRLTLETKREPVDAMTLEALELQQPIALEKGLELRCAAPAPGIEVVCDRDRILQVFGNLIGNAIKFCRAGDTITVTSEVIEDHVQFCVADTGPGIAPDVLPYLFEAYRSAPQHTTRGSGLGLYICRGIIEGHRGRLWGESTPGTGARFFFTLPIAGS